MRKKLIVFTLAVMALSAAANAAASPATIALVGQGSSTGGTLQQSVAGDQPPVVGNNNEQVRLTPQQAVELFTRQAEEGQAQAMYNLGTFYENGLGVPRNFSTALEWFVKAGEAGQTEGYHQAGIAYELGRGVAADRATAVKYLELAAEKKTPGLRLSVGRSVPGRPPERG